MATPSSDSSPPPPRLIAVTPQTLWQAAGIAGGLVLMVFVAIKASAVLLLIFTAIIIAEGMRPLTRQLQRLRLTRSLSILAIYVVVLGALTGLGWLLTAPLVAQVNQLVSNFPGYLNQIQSLFAQVQTVLGNNPALANAAQTVESQAGAFAGQLLTGVVSLPLNIATAIFSAVVVLTMAFFWLTGMDRALPFVLQLFPSQEHPAIEQALAQLSTRLGGFVRGALFNMFIIGVLSGMGIWLLGVPYALLLGIFAGLTEIIPFLGPYFGGSAAIIVASVTLGPLKGAEVLALYVVIQELEGNILVPIVMHRAVQLNPFGIIVAVLLGGALFGLAGSVLAVPLAVIVAVIYEHIIAPSIQRQTRAPTSTDSPTVAESPPVAEAPVTQA